MGSNKDINNWSPISHNTVFDMWRVPMSKIEDIHTLFVGDHFTRSFTTALLPDYILNKIVMINAVDNEYLNDDENINIFDMYTTTSLIDSMKLTDIGWKVSPSWYCLCLSSPELKDLRGET